MTERFEVEPAAVAGYGVLCGQVGGDCRAVGDFVRDAAKAGAGFDALIMGQLTDMVNAFAADTGARVTERAGLLEAAADELNRSAWLYRGEDALNEARFRPDYPTYTEPQYQDFPDATPFPYFGLGCDMTGFNPDTYMDGGFAEVVDGAETGGIADTFFGALDVIEWALSQIGVEFNWKEMTFGKVIGDGVTGDWNALKVCAGALDVSGDALTEAANALNPDADGGGNLAALLAEWEGDAADRFRDHITRLEAVVRFDGQLNRVVADVYRIAAELIKKTAETTVELLSELIKKIATYASRLKLVELGWEFGKDMFSGFVEEIKSVPYGLTGQPSPHRDDGDPWENLKAELEREWAEVKGLYDDAKSICAAITSLPDKIRTAIDLATDPLDTMKTMTAEQVNEKLAPVTDEVAKIIGDTHTEDGDVVVADQLKEVEQSIDDLNTVLTSDALENAPDDGFSVGAHPRRPGR